MEEMVEECSICGPHRTIVWSCVKSDKTQISSINYCETPLVSFLDWLFGELSNKYKSLVFAHFGGNLLFKDIKIYIYQVDMIFVLSMHAFSIDIDLNLKSLKMGIV
jgi:hypothetical protein